MLSKCLRPYSILDKFTLYTFQSPQLSVLFLLVIAKLHDCTTLYFNFKIIRSKKMIDTLCEIKALLILWSIQEWLLEIITFNGAHTLT